MEEKFFLDSFYAEYETDTSELAINGRNFKILLPRDLSQFINTDDVMHDFPLWAKIWPASWVLASHLASMPPSEEKNLLEIGGGIGLVSIVAASFGHHITMTEYNPDALQFARANAVINECPRLNILELDWNSPRPAGRFDYIVASEISYREEDIQPIMTLLKSSLKPDGEVLLAGEMRKLSKAYFKALETIFDIQALKKTLRSENQEIMIVMFRMTLKDGR
ncbi:MAG: methyltransferase [Desulfobacterales bacterium]